MKSLKDACWKGYEAIGTKKKNGRTVPNCVPKNEGVLQVAGDDSIRDTGTSAAALDKEIRTPNTPASRQMRGILDKNKKQQKRDAMKEQVEQIDEVSKEKLDTYIHKSFEHGNELHKQIEKETDPLKRASLRRKLKARNTGVQMAAKRLTTEDTSDKAHIEQHLADKDINSKFENDKVQVHHSNVEAAKKHLKRAGYHYDVVGGLNESDAAYAAALEKQKEKKLTKSDQGSLAKVRELMSKEKKLKEETEEQKKEREALDLKLKQWRSQQRAEKALRGESLEETTLNKNDPHGDYKEKSKALHDLSLNKDVDQKAVQQRKLDLDKEYAKFKEEDMSKFAGFNDFNKLEEKVGDDVISTKQRMEKTGKMSLKDKLLSIPRGFKAAKAGKSEVDANLKKEDADQIDESTGDRLKTAAEKHLKDGNELAYHKGMVKYHDHMADVHYGTPEGTRHEKSLQQHKSEVHALSEGVSDGVGMSSTDKDRLAFVAHQAQQHRERAEREKEAAQKAKEQKRKELNDKLQSYRNSTLNKYKSSSLNKEETEQIDEAESPTAGTRKVASYGDHASRAEVRYNPEYKEYSVHHYKDGKHTGEEQVSYHYDDKEDAHDTAKHEANKRSVKEETEQIAEATSEYHAHGFTSDAEKKAHADKVKKEHGVTVSWHNNKAGGSEALRYHGSAQGVKWASHDLNDKGAMHEESEQIDELSKDTLKSYVKGASQDLPRLGNTLGRLQTHGKLPNVEKNVSKTIRNRYNGINKATDKLTKEEVEQIDELSNKTLASYAKKADKASEKHYDKGYNLSMTHDDSDEKMNKVIDKHFAKSDKRAAGASLARSKMFAKEEVEQPMSMVEAALSVLDSGIKDIRDTYQLTEGTVHTKKYKWGTMKTVHHGHDFSIPLHPEHHKPIAKLKDGQEHHFKDETGKHWGAYRRGSDVHFISADHSGAYKTTVKHSSLHEEVEQVDELNKSTLASYIKKSSHDIALSAKYGGKDPKEFKHALRRIRGTAKAADKLAKEETEQIDEMTQGKEYSQKQLSDKIKSGNWEAQTDIKPGKHVEMRHHTGKVVTVHVKEEVEQIDEISKELVSNYVSGVVKQQASTNPSAFGKYEKLSDKRQKGIDNAFKRLIKREDVEQVDELNKSTLASYAKKSHDQLMKHTSTVNFKTGRGDKDAFSYEHDKDNMRKTANRTKGFKQAISKLAKEEAEQIDELSKKTLGSYAHKATDDAQDKAHDAYDAYSNVKDKQMHKAQHQVAKRIQGVERAGNKLGDKTIHKDVEKSVDQHIKQREAWYNGKTKKAGTHDYHAMANSEKAHDKIKKASGVDESVQLDELSKGTLSRYITKASRNATIHKGAAKDIEHTEKRYTPDSVRHDFKVQDRLSGIKKAAEKLAKEEVEQIDEISKAKLVQYVDKATQDIHNKAMAAGQAQPGEAGKFISNYNKSGKRQAGVVKAAVKLAREETDMISYKDFIELLGEAKIDDLKDRIAARKATQSAYDSDYKSDDKDDSKRTVKGKSYGAGKEDNDEDDENNKQEPQAKRGRGRPAGSKSGARA